jgi:hypothetical protein
MTKYLILAFILIICLENTVYAIRKYNKEDVSKLRYIINSARKYLNHLFSYSGMGNIAKLHPIFFVLYPQHISPDSDFSPFLHF